MMTSDAPGAAPEGETLSLLLRQVLEVAEVRRDRDGPMLHKTISGSEIGTPRADVSRETFEQVLLTLLRLLVGDDPALPSRQAGSPPAGSPPTDSPPTDSPPTDSPPTGDAEAGRRAAPGDALPPTGGSAAGSAPDPLARAFSGLMSLVELRRELLPDFSPYDESWDLLLCAALCERLGQGVSVSELCRRIGCALATGQRRVERLERLQLLDRAPDPGDLRRHAIFPTEKGRKAAADYVAAVGRRGLLQL